MQLCLPETTGLTLREEGLALIEAHAGDFLRVMRGLAERMAKEHGSVSADELRPLADSLGLVPHHPNAWGSLFKAPGWRCIDTRISTTPSAHARLIRVWVFDDRRDP
jgi:hypothetical protein